ncbi:MAG: VCBS repeat-containing protein [Methylococcaceae bacterium]|nr:VCBS repeat-containing protein [Methylococcaceae bacterium]
MNQLSNKAIWSLALYFLMANANAVTNYNQRVIKVSYDFDANGVTDATDVFHYNFDGSLADFSYVYTGDSIVDKLNTRDKNFNNETNTFSYNSEGLVNRFVVDRGSEIVESNAIFLNSQISRIDMEVRDDMGNVSVHQHWLFDYINNDLNQVQNIDTLTGNLVSILDFFYDSNGLPFTMDMSFQSSELIFANTFTWSSDFQIGAISTVIAAIGTGNVDLFYDAQNRLSNELWSFTGFVGSPYAKLQNTNYRKSYFYNVDNLKVREEYDLDDNGNIDAILTYEWEQAPCLPSFYWAPNGMPNFITTSDFSYVAGTGAFQFEFCGGTANNVPISLSNTTDFNGDGKADILIQKTNGFLAMYEMDGAIRNLSAVGGLSNIWTVDGIGDFGGDGKADILIRKDNGFLAMYQMDGPMRSLSAVGGLPLDWTVEGVGDFSGDGKADILIRKDNGFLAMYQMDGPTRSLSIVGGLTLNWTVEGIGDFGGDGKADILIRNTSGFLAMYQMDGPIRTLSAVGGLPNEWTVEGIGDFNGDGKADILIRKANGILAMYQMNGAIRTLNAIGGLPLTWAIEQVGDFSGDGKADILIRNSNGFLAMYQMDGAIRTLFPIGGLPTAWNIQPPRQP